ncbi:MAG: hypothetical protein ACR2OO_06740, partial [Thermomicrobiales bacterium]
RNALTHGLSGEGIVLPEGEAEAVRERMAEWHSSLRPFDSFQTWLLEVVAVESRRVERCRAREAVVREELARRAEESWDEDRKREAEEVSAWRTSNPGLACARLRSGQAGCRMLLEWWMALGRALEDGGWGEAQESLAHDLLGVPEALRTGAASPLNGGSEAERTEHRRGIVAEEIGRLDGLLAEAMPARDERARRAAVLGLSADEDRDLARLRRYEGSCLRRLQWARQQMRKPENKPLDEPRLRHRSASAAEAWHRRDETNPIAPAVPIHARAETNPIAPAVNIHASDETNPIAPAANVHARDETNPIAPAANVHARDETNPIAGSEPIPAMPPGDSPRPRRKAARTRPRLVVDDAFYEEVREVRRINSEKHDKLLAEFYSLAGLTPDGRLPGSTEPRNPSGIRPLSNRLDDPP